MKNAIILLFLVFNISTNNTTSDVFGKYMKKFETKEGNTFGFLLDVYKEGKFTLQCYRKIVTKNPVEEVIYARGNWSVKDNSIIFKSFKNDSSPNKKMIDITGVKAEFKAKSGNTNKSSFKFYNSDIPWLKGLEVFRLNKH